MSGEAAEARCSVQRFNFTLGQTDASTVMTADSGVPCNIKLYEGPTSIFRSIAAARRPARGSLRPQNSVNVAYQSRAGYQGTDSFAFTIVGTRNGVPARSTVMVTVTVASSGMSPPMAGGAARPAPSKAALRAGAPASALVTKCRQQAGAFIDPITKRWLFTGTERELASRTDMFRLCLAGGDRQRAKTIAVPELHRSLGQR